MLLPFLLLLYASTNNCLSSTVTPNTGPAINLPQAITIRPLRPEVLNISTGVTHSCHVNHDGLITSAENAESIISTQLPRDCWNIIQLEYIYPLKESRQTDGNILRFDLPKPLQSQSSRRPDLLGLYLPNVGQCNEAISIQQVQEPLPSDSSQVPPIDVHLKFPHDDNKFFFLPLDIQLQKGSGFDDALYVTFKIDQEYCPFLDFPYASSARLVQNYVPRSVETKGESIIPDFVWENAFPKSDNICGDPSTFLDKKHKLTPGDLCRQKYRLRRAFRSISSCRGNASTFGFSLAHNDALNGNLFQTPSNRESIPTDSRHLVRVVSLELRKELSATDGEDSDSSQSCNWVRLYHSQVPFENALMNFDPCLTGLTIPADFDEQHFLMSEGRLNGKVITGNMLNPNSNYAYGGTFLVELLHDDGTSKTACTSDGEFPFSEGIFDFYPLPANKFPTNLQFSEAAIECKGKCRIDQSIFPGLSFVNFPQTELCQKQCEATWQINGNHTMAYQILSHPSISRSINLSSPDTICNKLDWIKPDGIKPSTTNQIPMDNLALISFRNAKSETCSPNTFKMKGKIALPSSSAATPLESVVAYPEYQGVSSIDIDDCPDNNILPHSLSCTYIVHETYQFNLIPSNFCPKEADDDNQYMIPISWPTKGLDYFFEGIEVQSSSSSCKIQLDQSRWTMGKYNWDTISIMPKLCDRDMYELTKLTKTSQQIRGGLISSTCQSEPNARFIVKLKYKWFKGMHLTKLILSESLLESSNVIFEGHCEFLTPDTRNLYSALTDREGCKATLQSNTLGYLILPPPSSTEKSSFSSTEKGSPLSVCVSDQYEPVSMEELVSSAVSELGDMEKFITGKVTLDFSENKVAVMTASEARRLMKQSDDPCILYKLTDRELRLKPITDVLNYPLTDILFINRTLLSVPLSLNLTIYGGIHQPMKQIVNSSSTSDLYPAKPLSKFMAELEMFESQSLRLLRSKEALLTEDYEMKSREITYPYRFYVPNLTGFKKYMREGVIQKDEHEDELVALKVHAKKSGPMEIGLFDSYPLSVPDNLQLAKDDKKNNDWVFAKSGSFGLITGSLGSELTSLQTSRRIELPDPAAESNLIQVEEKALKIQKYVIGDNGKTCHSKCNTSSTKGTLLLADMTESCKMVLADENCKLTLNAVVTTTIDTKILTGCPRFDLKRSITASPVPKNGLVIPVDLSLLNTTQIQIDNIWAVAGSTTITKSPAPIKAPVEHRNRCQLSYIPVEIPRPKEQLCQELNKPDLAIINNSLTAGGLKKVTTTDHHNDRRRRQEWSSQILLLLQPSLGGGCEKVLEAAASAKIEITIEFSYTLSALGFKSPSIVTLRTQRAFVDHPEDYSYNNGVFLIDMTMKPEDLVVPSTDTDHIIFIGESVNIRSLYIKIPASNDICEAIAYKSGVESHDSSKPLDKMSSNPKTHTTYVFDDAIWLKDLIINVTSPLIIKFNKPGLKNQPCHVDPQRIEIGYSSAFDNPKNIIKPDTLVPQWEKHLIPKFKIERQSGCYDAFNNIKSLEDMDFIIGHLSSSCSFKVSVEYSIPIRTESLCHVPHLTAFFVIPSGTQIPFWLTDNQYTAVPSGCPNPPKVDGFAHTNVFELNMNHTKLPRASLCDPRSLGRLIRSAAHSSSSLLSPVESLTNKFSMNTKIVALTLPDRTTSSTCKTDPETITWRAVMHGTGKVKVPRIQQDPSKPILIIKGKCESVMAQIDNIQSPADLKRIEKDLADEGCYVKGSFRFMINRPHSTPALGLDDISMCNLPSVPPEEYVPISISEILSRQSDDSLYLTRVSITGASRAACNPNGLVVLGQQDIAMLKKHFAHKLADQSHCWLYKLPNTGLLPRGQYESDRFVPLEGIKSAVFIHEHCWGVSKLMELRVDIIVGSMVPLRTTTVSPTTQARSSTTRPKADMTVVFYPVVIGVIGAILTAAVSYIFIRHRRL